MSISLNESAIVMKSMLNIQKRLWQEISMGDNKFPAGKVNYERRFVNGTKE